MRELRSGGISRAFANAEFVHELAAYSTLFLTVGLAIGRPRVGLRFRVGPAHAAIAGVILMFLLGLIDTSDVALAANTLWRPFAVIALMMLATAACSELGVFAFLASKIARIAGGSPRRFLLLVFGTGALVSAILNNDSVILFLTPLVISAAKRAFPGRRDLFVPFAFAVFASTGVAPLATSNPMNMIVVSAAGISFAEYAATMLPISVASAAITLLCLLVLFHRVLARPALPVLAAAPAAVALRGARAVSWDILIFLFGVFLIAKGLEHAGVVARLRDLYQGSGVLSIGLWSALGSALLNNHPMALLNMLALQGTPPEHLFAALIGGDLGPRLLPIGSLAGLLWLESLKRERVPVSILDFAKIGALVTVPSLLASLYLL